MKTRDKIIWGNIEDLLAEKGWTLAEFARQVKTRQQTINSIKFGVRGIGPNLFARFAAALGVPEETLLITDEKGVEVAEGTSREIILLLETMRDAMKEQSKRIDEMQSRIEAQAKVVSRYADEVDKLGIRIVDVWKAIELKDQSLISINSAVDAINQALISVKGRMLDAAKSGNVQALGGAIVNE